MDNFDKATILKLSKEPDSIKLDVIEKYAEKLGGYFIAILSKDMNEDNRMKIIGEYADKLGSQRIAVLAQNMPDEYKLKIIDVGCIENFEKVKGPIDVIKKLRYLLKILLKRQ